METSSEPTKTTDVTAAPYLPGKDPLTPGKNTTEFLTTVAGLFISGLFGVLAAFNVLTLNDVQKDSIYQFVAVSWVALPIAYAFARSYVKGKAVTGEGGK